MNKREMLEHTAKDNQKYLVEKRFAGEKIERIIPEKLSREDAFADFAYLRYIMEEGYSGYTYYEKSLWDNAFAAIEKELNSRDEITPEEMFAVFHDHLSFICDGHLSFSVKDKFFRFFENEVAYVADMKLRKQEDGSFSCLETGERVLPCGDTITFETLPDENGPLYLLGVLSKKKIETVRALVAGEITDVPVHVIATEPRPETRGKGEPVENYYDDVAVITCKSFGGNPAVLLDHYYRAGLRCRTCKHVVLDMVNNGGGNSLFPQKFFEGLYGWSYHTSKVDVLHSSILTAKHDGTIDENVERRFVRRERPDMTRTENAFDGKLHVVINSGVASSAELAVCMSWQYPNTTYYGTCSAGIGKYGDVLTWIFPKSNASMGAPYKIFDNGINETIGYRPNIWVDSTDPIGDIKAYIERTK